MLLETLLICASLTVVDGDTVKCHRNGLPNQNLRLLGEGIPNQIGIDAPEKGRRAHCEAERLGSDKASQRLSVLLNDGVTRIEVKGVDVFDRPLVNIYLTNGREVGKTLLEEGFVKSWVKSKKVNWCN